MSLNLFQYTENFNIHYLMTMLEYGPNRARPSRLKLLLRFNERHGHKYDSQVKTAMQTMLMNKGKATWVFDQWYWICHSSSPCKGSAALDEYVSGKLLPAIELLRTKGAAA